MRLIDADTKKFCIHSDGLGYCDILGDDETRQYCVESPCPHEKLVEYEPVRHGRWIDRGEWVDCSECGTVGSPHWKRCPVCEAKMETLD